METPQAVAAQLCHLEIQIVQYPGSKISGIGLTVKHFSRLWPQSSKRNFLFFSFFVSAVESNIAEQQTLVIVTFICESCHLFQVQVIDMHIYGLGLIMRVKGVIETMVDISVIRSFKLFDFSSTQHVLVFLSFAHHACMRCLFFGAVVR